MKISSVVFALLTRALLGGRKKFILLHTRVDAVENKCFQGSLCGKTSEKQSGSWGDGWGDGEKNLSYKLTHCQPCAEVSAVVIAGCAGKKIPILSQLHGFAEMRRVLQSEKWWFSSECLKVIQSSQTHFFILMVIPQNTLLHLNSQTAPNQRQGNTFQPLSCVSLKSFCQTQTNKRQRYRKNWILSTCRAGSLWPVWQWTACVSWKVWNMKLPKIGRSDVWCIVRQLQQQ